MLIIYNFLSPKLIGMEISVNGKSEQIKTDLNLASLVATHVGEKLNGIAVAINQQVIPKTEWEQKILKENDSILIIKATQGG